MSETNDLSRRFVADFFAARLRAIRIDKDAIRRTAAGEETSPRAEQTPPRKPITTDPSLGGIPMIERRSRFRPGLRSSP
jgi:hypothetical protein